MRTINEIRTIEKVKIKFIEINNILAEVKGDEIQIENAGKVVKKRNHIKIKL